MSQCRNLEVDLARILEDAASGLDMGAAFSFEQACLANLKHQVTTSLLKSGEIIGLYIFVKFQKDNW